MKKLITYTSLVLLLFVNLLNAQTMTANSDEKSIEQKEQKIDKPIDKPYESKKLIDMVKDFYHTMGIFAFFHAPENKDPKVSDFHLTYGKLIMILICLGLFYLAIAKGFEPLLLLPIGFGGLLANIPLADIAGDDGFLGIIYNMGIANSLFPVLIFMGVGALTDFGPLLANPKMALLGGAAQFGIFTTLIGAVVLTEYTSIFDFSLQDAAAIGIIGGADGPTAIFIASRLSPDLLGAIAVAAYSYMALVPMIQPPYNESPHDTPRASHQNEAVAIGLSKRKDYFSDNGIDTLYLATPIGDASYRGFDVW